MGIKRPYVEKTDDLSTVRQFERRLRESLCDALCLFLPARAPPPQPDRNSQAE
jgi:hypothetical protein